MQQRTRRRKRILLHLLENNEEYKMNNAPGIIISIITILSVVAIIGLYLVNDGTITINKPYYEEYKQCEQQLNQNQVQCPEVKCNCGATGIIWTIMGAIFGLSGYAMYWHTLNKAEQIRNKKVK